MGMIRKYDAWKRREMINCFIKYAKDIIEEDGSIQDDYRIDYLKKHIIENRLLMMRLI